MAGMMRKSMVMTAILAIALTGFVGFLAAEEPPLAEPVVTIEDTFAPFDDKNAYVGDTFTFMVDGYDAPVNNSNVSVTVKIGPLDPADMVWNTTTGMWEYAFTFPVDPAYVGTHDVVFTASDANNASNVNITTEQITLWHPVLYVDGTLPTFTEDMMTSWVISDFFAPLQDVTGAPLTFAAVSPPDDWGFASAVVENVTTWTLTPPAEFFGSVDVNVTATDSNGVMNYHVFTISVGAVNDGPMIEGIMVGESLYTVSTWNAGTATNPDNRTAINLTLVEDTPLDIMVHASDIDSMDLTYAMTLDEALYAVAETPYQMVNETNVTINYTVASNLTITPVADANGDFWAELNVSDGALWAVVAVNVMITPTNDAPTATEAWDDTYEIKTDELFNVTLADIADIDGDAVTAMWYIDGTMVADWDEIYFAYTWTAAGTYNVSAKISDGTATVDVGYFHVTVELSNTAPPISLVQAIPKGMSAADVIAFLLKGEVEEGKDVLVTAVALDLDGDTLTYVWTNNVNTAWTVNTTTGELTVLAKDLEVGKSYTFTCKVVDGNGGEATLASNTIKIVAKEDNGGLTTIIIIVIAIIAILAILIILFFVLRGGKEEEEPVTEETPTEETPTEEAPVEEGAEAPAPEEQPVAEETPAEAPAEGEEVPAPPETPQ